MGWPVRAPSRLELPSKSAKVVSRGALEIAEHLLDIGRWPGGDRSLQIDDIHFFNLQADLQCGDRRRGSRLHQLLIMLLELGRRKDPGLIRLERVGDLVACQNLRHG